MQHVNKNHQRKTEIWLGQKTRPRMNYECIGKTIKEKMRSYKLEKTQKH